MCDNKRIILDLLPVTAPGILTPQMEADMGCFLTEGTELRHRQIQQGPVTIECEYDEAYSAPEVVSLAVEACAGEEIDGIFVNCFGDPGVRALRVELRSMDGEPIVTLERRWGRSPDTAMDPLSLLAIIARKPRSWGESPIRSDFPEETRVLLDRMEPRERGLLVDDIRHAAVVSGFRAAVMAVVEIVAAGRRPDRAAIDQTARRIAQGDGPESRARLDTYSRFMREDGDE